MRVGFLNNQIDNRGTGNAVFDYAHYNEEILGNESYVVFIGGSPVDQQMYDRLRDRFGPYRFFITYGDFFPPDLDVLYHIKSGEDDGFRAPKGVKYVVHGVFKRPDHGDRTAVVSPWMANRDGGPFVPHIVSLPETELSFRSSLGIKQTDLVFGRHGGADSFDISFAWSAINRALKAREDVWFLFMNTNQPDVEFYDPKRVLFSPGTADPMTKRIFINTCDAMLHARQRGETFGIACGEFASLGKPIITYGLSGERNHLEEVPCYVYNDEDELAWHLIENDWIKMKEESMYWTGYTQYTPENVMAKFKEVFLDE